MQTSDWVTAITTAATILSVLIAGYALWRQLSFLRRQMAIQHFSEYARRYAQVVERLPERIHESECHLIDLGPADTVMPAIRTFFATCFEEWYLHERGYFDQGMWNTWRQGMRNLLTKPAIREAWERISGDTDYGKEFAAFVLEEMAAAVDASSSRVP
jgi:hypothetical protein